MRAKVRKEKKKWIRVVGPSFLHGQLLGESYASHASDLIGRRLDLNISYLTGDIKRQNVILGFRIIEAKGSDAYADIISYSMVNAYVKRIVRAGKDKIDDSFTVETKDKFFLRIKPVMLVKSKTKNSTLTTLRALARENFSKLAHTHDLKMILDGVISGKIQRDLKQLLNKIYPLNVFEIRKLDIVR